MPKETPNNLATECPPGERQLRAEAELLIPPPGLPTPPVGKLHRLIRCLVLAPTDPVRALVILHLYHELSIPDAAARMGADPRAAQEQFDSVAARERMVDERRRHEEELRKMQRAEAEKTKGAKRHARAK